MRLKNKLFIAFVVIIMAILFSLKVEASVNYQEDTFDGFSASIEGDNIRKGKNGRDKSSDIILTLSSEEETMASFTCKIAIKDYPRASNGKIGLLGVPTKVESLVKGWEVTEKSFDYTDEDDGKVYLTFTAKANEELIESRNAPQSVSIEITSPVNTTNDMDDTTTMHNYTTYYVDNIKTKDYDNAEVQHYPFLELELYEVEDYITVKSGYEENVHINLEDNSIYAKFDSHNGILEETLWSDFSVAIEGLDDVYNWYSSTARKGDEENKKLESGDFEIYPYDDDYKVFYDLYVIGDVYRDGNSQIDINDVIYLRRAIVGIDMSREPFCMEASDVNNSNTKSDGERGLGDIGDVIAIRKRILSGSWDDMAPIVTTPPTTEVTEKIKYKDTSSDNKIATIPQGFKVSTKSDEQKIDDGLVVIAPDGSQFVWIPVQDVSTMYGTLEDGTLAGKLYGTGKIDTPTNWTETGDVMSWINDTGDREVDILVNTNDGDASSTVDRGLNLLKSIVGIQGTVGTDNEQMLATWKEQLQNEFEEMIESVKKYGGFYIGRNETSLKQGVAQSKQGESPATAGKSGANTWYGLYQKQKEYSEKNSLSNVVGSSMVWGSQYDQMLIWMRNHGINVTSSEPIEGATGNTSRITGTSNKDKLKNIYDLMGNSREWTMEALNTYLRVYRRRRFG